MRIAIQAENLVGGANFRHAGVGRYSYSIIDHMLRIGDGHEWHLILVRLRHRVGQRGNDVVKPLFARRVHTRVNARWPAT